MDADRFDALVRSLSEGASRRRALGLTSGSILGLLGLADAAARKRKKKCKKKCGPCKKCKKGKCKPKPIGTACGACHVCDATGQCVNVPDTTPCDDGKLCTVNTVCSSGVCGGSPANQGQICGISKHGGTALRCCNGVCPDPDCVPSGDTSIACNGQAICNTVKCCAEQGATCNDPSCRCFFALAGQPCGSDHDCTMAGQTTACICGTCQAPPP